MYGSSLRRSCSAFTGSPSGGGERVAPGRRPRRVGGDRAGGGGGHWGSYLPVKRLFVSAISRCSGPKSSIARATVLAASALMSSESVWFLTSLVVRWVVRST